MGIKSQLAEFRDLTQDMLRELKAVRALLQIIVNQEEQRSNSYTVTIDEAQWRAWQGQERDEPR